MKILNLTNQVQEISVIDRNNRSLTHSIYIGANGNVDLDNDLVVQNLKVLTSKKIIRVLDGVGVPSIEEAPVTNSPIIEEDVGVPDDTDNNLEEDSKEDLEDEVIEEDDLNNNEEVNDELETTPDSFICPHCNAEYASERGLNMHINKSHK